MLIYFELIAIVSLFCLGLRAVTDDGMIGYPIRKWALDNFPTWGKPVVLCSTCMSSFWGTIIFWSHTLSLESYDHHMIANWLGVCISSAFVNSVLWAYYESINNCKV